MFVFFFFQAEDGIRDAQESRGLGDVYKRQPMNSPKPFKLKRLMMKSLPCVFLCAAMLPVVMYLSSAGTAPDPEVEVFAENGEAMGPQPVGIVLSQGWLHKSVHLIVLSATGQLLLRETMQDNTWGLPIERLRAHDSFQSAVTRLAAAECAGNASRVFEERQVEWNTAGVHDHHHAQVWCCDSKAAREGSADMMASVTELKGLRQRPAAIVPYMEQPVDRVLQLGETWSCVTLKKVYQRGLVVDATSSPRS
eukprot:TRINITY_DN63107_c0_g2_i1.p1 TRINITY_DN63107_c0_g2~~TRINITY_DN63107_c0_g2_i1.p1  ORF type:complete len:251 (+),score=67.22 TRINITY_DN63107_c0_g2_i1:78-830(+)